MRIRTSEDIDITGVKNIFAPTGKGGAPGVEAHDVAQFRTRMTDSRRFTTRRGFSGNLDKRFKESAGLVQEIRQQLAGVWYE